MLFFIIRRNPERLIEVKHTGFLLVARQEPGNPADKNYILLDPTIQASESNLLQKHGDKKPPFAELIDEYGEPEWAELPQDGGRFLGKINKYGILRIGSADEVMLPPNARWFASDEITEALLKGEANEHLTQALAVLFCQTEL